MAELRFHIAGLPVAVRGDIGDLAAVYARFPTTAAPALTVDVERVAGFDRAQGPEYPAFRRGLISVPGAGQSLRVERYDAEGEIDTGELPLTARFRVGPSPNSLEACVRIAASVALARHGALILHASAVEHAGRALVFTGVSGAGKSTISSLLDGVGTARKIGDELLVLSRATDGAWQVYVPPYLGPAGIAHGAGAPLEAVHFLVQAPHHARTRVQPTAALREILRHVLVYVAEPRTADRVLALAADLTHQVPFHRLEFLADAGVAGVLGIAYHPRAEASRS